MPNEGPSHGHQEHDAKRQKPQPQEQATRGLEGPGQTVVEATAAYQRVATAPPPAIRPEDIKALQMTAGNSAVTRMLAARSQGRSVIAESLLTAAKSRPDDNGNRAVREREAVQPADLVVARDGLDSSEGAQGGQTARGHDARQAEMNELPVQARTAGKARSEGGRCVGDWVQRGPGDDDEGGGAKKEAAEAIRKLPDGPKLPSKKGLEKSIKEAEKAKREIGRQPREVFELEVSVAGGDRIEAERKRAEGHEKWATAQEYGGGTLEIAEYAGELAGSQLATSGRAGVELAGKALGWIGVAFGAISAFFDLKSLITTGRKRKELQEVLSEAAEQFGDDPQNKAQQEVKGFILYAMKQKYRKWWKRLISFCSSVAATAVAVPALIAGVSLAALASNPAGWVVAGVIAIAAAVAGVGLLVHRFWRWCKKGKRRGAERLRRAGTIFEHFQGVAGTLKDLAGRAIGSLLGRDKWNVMSEEYDRTPEGQKEAKGATIIKLIARKLKST